MIEVLDLLLAAGCDINATDSTGQTPLFGWDHFAWGKQEMQTSFISALLSRGANSEVLDRDGSSVLHRMRGRRTELSAVKLLVFAGADINVARKSDGRTPLINATQMQQLMDPTIFHDMGADFDRQDHDGSM